MTEQGKLDEAIAYFDELIADEPNFSKAYGERGRVRNLKGDKQGALEDLKKAIELNPNGEEAQRMNGQHTNFNNLYQGGIYWSEWWNQSWQTKKSRFLLFITKKGLSLQPESVCE